DAVLFATGVGGGVISEAFSTMDVRFLRIKDSLVEGIKRLHPYHAEGIIRAGTYEGQEEDVRVIGDVMTVEVRRDVPEDVVYRATKITWDHVKDGSLATVSRAFSEWTLSPQIEQVTGSPLHPGARKFYEENGVEIK
ncbi:unnamed protein product, partial [marine sediment metagenome]